MILDPEVVCFWVWDFYCWILYIYLCFFFNCFLYISSSGLILLGISFPDRIDLLLLELQYSIRAGGFCPDVYSLLLDTIQLSNLINLFFGMTLSFEFFRVCIFLSLFPICYFLLWLNQLLWRSQFRLEGSLYGFNVTIPVVVNIEQGSACPSVLS